MDMRHFTIQPWVEKDLFRLKHIPTGDNSSDLLTKITPSIFFNRHTDYILGKTIPHYDSDCITKTYTQSNDALSTGG